MSARRIAIVGAGVAGVQAALGARSIDPDALITLYGAEDVTPYDRTALSKQVLVEGTDPERLPIVPPGQWHVANVALRKGVRVASIDTAGSALRLDDGTSETYDVLILATGAEVRRLPDVPAGSVHYIRNRADALELRRGLLEARRLVVIGAGLIGLEVAAAARALGIDVEVLEADDVILRRSADEATAAVVDGMHRDNGVRMRTGMHVSSLEALSPGVRVNLTGGEHVDADVVVAGIGVVPNVLLAEAAGIATDDGVLVDEFGRTSVANVYAAGDVARLPLPFSDVSVRAESWRHAQDHGHAVGRNAAGANEAFGAVPGFWSDQFGRRILGCGFLRAESTCITRRYPDGSHTSFLVGADRVVRGAIGIDRAQDINAARRLVAARTAVDPVALADPGVSVSRIVKSLISQGSNP